jgi:hypothetical protein
MNNAHNIILSDSMSVVAVKISISCINSITVMEHKSYQGKVKIF